MRVRWSLEFGSPALRVDHAASRTRRRSKSKPARLAEVLPPGCRVTILADRGFGGRKPFAFLSELGFGYVIRFRGNTRVTDAAGETRPAAEWVGKAGRARKLRDARVTAQGQRVGAVVCVHDEGMKEPWCLAASDPETPVAEAVNHYV